MRNSCIYPQVKIHMILKDLNNEMLAEKAGIHYISFLRKMKGTTNLYLDEAKRIKKALDCNLSLDDLFKTKDEINI